VLKILHVVESYGAGTMQVVRMIAERQIDEGHRAAIAYGVRPETPADVSAGLDPRIELHPLPWTSRRPVAQLRAGRALRKLAKAYDPDVVHLHSSFAGFVGATSLGRRYRVVYTPHAYAFQQVTLPRILRAGFAAAERLVARRVALVAGVSEHEAQLARTVARAPRAATVINGIPELDEPVAARGDRADRTLVVSAGRAGAQRMPDRTARILRGVADSADVQWIGGGSRSDPGVAALAAAGVPVTGWLSRADALAQLRSATVYLHWSRWDGLSLAILEAMANDVIVIASDIPPNVEVLGEEQTCASEREALALIREILENEELRAKLRARQRRRAARFGARRMTDEWLRIYADLADRRPVTRRPGLPAGAPARAASQT
jgi:glycosyltransferase involved in cell wall biosynthesis